MHCGFFVICWIAIFASRILTIFLYLTTYKKNRREIGIVRYSRVIKFPENKLFTVVGASNIDHAINLKKNNFTSGQVCIS